MKYFIINSFGQVICSVILRLVFDLSATISTITSLIIVLIISTPLLIYDVRKKFEVIDIDKKRIIKKFNTLDKAEEYILNSEKRLYIYGIGETNEAWLVNLYGDNIIDANDVKNYRMTIL